MLMWERYALSDDLKAKKRAMSVKAVDVVRFLVEQGHASTEKPLMNTAIIDLCFKGRENQTPVKMCFFNNYLEVYFK